MPECQFICGVPCLGRASLPLLPYHHHLTIVNDVVSPSQCSLLSFLEGIQGKASLVPGCQRHDACILRLRSVCLLNQGYCSSQLTVSNLPSVNEDGTLRVRLYRIRRNTVQRDAHSMMNRSSSITGATSRKKSTAKRVASRRSQGSRARIRTSRPSCQSAAVQEAPSSPIWLPTQLPGRHLRWVLANSATAMGLTGSIVRLFSSQHWGLS